MASCCPLCHRKSARVHSHYTRQLADLPWLGIPVHIELRVRRFFCDNVRCDRSIFTERLPQVAAAYARKTCRLGAALELLALALGGEHGARVAGELAMASSSDTLLRLIRRIPLPVNDSPRVLGVDDWALRKGTRYGTILCDLQRHRILDLLPDYAAESLRAWLAGHPEVKTIARDRGSVLIRGATAGAPQARQVADRFHLLENLREALIRVAERFPAQINTAWRSTALAMSQSTPVTAVPDPATPQVPAPLPSGPPPANPKRMRRLERYQQVHALHREGLGYRSIAARLGMAKNTARRFLRASSFPERAIPQRRHRVASYDKLLRQRWQEGCRDAVVLWRQLCQQGFDGSYHMVRRWVRPWRDPHAPEAARTTGPRPNKQVRMPSERVPSARQVGWYLAQRADDRAPRQQRFVAALAADCPDIAAALRFAEEFSRMVRKREANSLTQWVAAATAPASPSELAGFAQGLRQDFAAVKAALRLPWSTGQVEGHINRVKLIKRQMYGRANFDLLRRRVLLAG